jgi:hypothetical protein
MAASLKPGYFESPIQVRETQSLFHQADNEPLCVVAVRINDPDHSPVGINR